MPSSAANAQGKEELFIDEADFFLYFCKRIFRCKNLIHSERTMKLGIVSDEISLNFREAVSYGLEWGIEDYELRCVRSGRVPYISQEEIADILAMKKERGINITAISPGMFKLTLHDRKGLERELTQVFDDSMRLAERLGTNLIITFGIMRAPGDEDGYQQVLDLFGRLAGRAQEHGFMLAVENEPGFWCDTGSGTARILQAVNSPHLMANWDPGNSFTGGERPYPDGYRALKDWVINMHIKDYVTTGDGYKAVVVGQGEIDYAGQLKELAHDRALHHVTLETHCEPLLETSRQSAAWLQRILAAL